MLEKTGWRPINTLLMERITLFAEILLPLPIEGTFTYRVPYELNDFLEVGHRVAVQFGRKKIYAGIVVKIHQDPPEKGLAKYILSVLDEKPVVNEQQLRFWKWMASYYLSTEGEVLSAALPSAFRLASEGKVMLSPGFVPDRDILSEFEYRITEALLEKKKLTVDQLSKIVGYTKVLPLLKNMIDKKYILMEEELEEKYKPRKERFVRIAPEVYDEDILQGIMNELSKRAFKQLELLMKYLTMSGLENPEPKWISQKELLKGTESSSAIVKALEDKGIFQVEEKTVSRLKTDVKGDVSAGTIVLSEAQQKAYGEIKEKFEEHHVVLLHGVTSSGKTEMYIKLIAETLEKGKQALYLLPEIALTTQIINRLRKYFGNRVGVYHSQYSTNERVEIWKNIAGLSSDEEQYSVIVGPRSAMFLPFSDLGLVIIDEEHDHSFKQFDPSPRYNARDSAVYLGTMYGARILLGSATPSLESYANTLSGKYGLVEITERFGNIRMPEIIIVNLKEEHRRKLMQSHFSSVLISHIRKALENKEQVILFQNRRGFSLRLECRECQWTPVCKNCDVTLTYHKPIGKLKCHYCGYTEPVPSKCEVCGSHQLKLIGFGTQKVEEELQAIFPEATIDRMDLDSTRTKNAFRRIFEDFENGKTDILTGTQMVTKGLDFDNVRVVGVLNADNMLSYPDFRAHERSFQLMAQVSGRAGRKNKRGEVIIQTWKPDHPVIRDVLKNDYLNMFYREMNERKKFKYPPYYRLIRLIIKHKDVELLKEGAEALGMELKAVFGNRVFGPEFPVVSRIRGLYLNHILLKNPTALNQGSFKEKLKETLEKYRQITKYRSLIIQVDVDPQ
jgi:primosomal protein N' (replication factor Y)